ncbi:MAG TPA: STAS domain-containing protein [Terriglobales bacterium]|jgi:anti-anti-sigma factor|nr:STAS domain-containing protein [Terriglobales bacterium]
MEIVTQQLGDALEVKVRGRLDNYWTEHLGRNLDEVIRGGAHNIRLNLSEISFLSSAGVGLLVRVHTQLKSIGGAFVITSPSARVKQVLDLCRLSNILLSERSPVAPPMHRIEARRFSSPAASFEVLDCDPAGTLVCHRIGDPGLLKGCHFGPQDCRTVAFPQATFGLGLGAFGEGFEDAQGRFGEFLAVGGSAAYLPTDGTNVPDFMVSSGALVPEMNVLYGLRCEGGFSHVMRFETTSAESPISLTELVRTALEISRAPAIGIVMVVESAGLVGAALRRSPAAAAGANDGPFKYPEVRSWLSFSTERLYSRSLALVSGIAAGSECAALAPLLRPVGAETWPAGHFHAAAFSYRPLKKGDIDLGATVTTLFETETLQGVLHLLTDNREAAGPQQSEFVRGACWIGAAAEIK